MKKNTPKNSKHTSKEVTTKSLKPSKSLEGNEGKDLLNEKVPTPEKKAKTARKSKSSKRTLKIKGKSSKGFPPADVAPDLPAIAQELMPESKELTKTASNINSEYEDWWLDTEKYVDESSHFDPEVWTQILSGIQAGRTYEEKVVAKCVRDEIPKRYQMTQGQFFGEFWGLENFQVSKYVRRDRMRSLVDETFMEGDLIKDSLLDKIASFEKKGVPADRVIEVLMTLCEEDFKFPTVAKFESSMTALLSEENHLKELLEKDKAYLESYTIEDSDEVQKLPTENGQVKDQELSQRALLAAVLNQLQGIQKAIDEMISK